jgi:ABC-type multidrug transport system fused ATPase/permease subunit
VIHDGELVEIGSHDELVARGGRYAALFDTWRSQASASRVE